MVARLTDLRLFCDGSLVRGEDLVAKSRVSQSLRRYGRDDVAHRYQAISAKTGNRQSILVLARHARRADRSAHKGGHSPWRSTTSALTASVDADVCGYGSV